MEDNQTQQPQQNNQINPSQSFIHRWLPTIVGVVIVVFVGGGVLAYQNWWSKVPELAVQESQTVSEFPDTGERVGVDKTANWKTYRNEELGFEFEYPTSIFEFDISNNTIFHELDNFQLRSAKDGSIVGSARDISFTFRDDVSRCSEFKKTFEEFGSGGEAFQVGNIVGTKYRTGAEGEGVVYHCVEDEKGNAIFLIERGYLDNSYSSFLGEQPDFILSEKQDQLSKQILSTFKFIEIDEIANWKTYRNEELGYEIKYPSEGEVTKTSYGLRIILPIEEGTNLSEKYLDITLDGKPPHIRQSEEGDVLINGNLFIKERGGGAAAGNRYETEFYTINREGRKYILSFTLHSGNIGNYDPSIRPKVFDKDQEKKIFDQMLSTFKFTD